MPDRVAIGDGGDGEQGRSEGSGGDVTTRFGEQQGGFDPAEADAAEVLGQRDGQPALLDHGVPQRLVVGRAGLEVGPHLLGRCVAVEQIAGGGAERLLVFGEVELHG